MFRFCLCLLFALSVTACSSVPNNYAFWRDNNVAKTDGRKPNLGDVPAPPATTQDAQADIDTMKQRLQQDRDKAYMAAQGVVPIEEVHAETPVSVPATPAPAVITRDELAPVAAQAMAAPAYDYYSHYPPMPVSTGNVQYNYGSTGESYVYGHSPVQINSQSVYQEQAASVMAANPSVSIDFSALDGGSSGDMGMGPSTVMAMGSGQPLVYFNHGSSRLGSLDKKRIQELAMHMKQQPVSLVILGHASSRTGVKDPVTSQVVNLQMSAKRAQVVLRELARHGVKSDQVKITANSDAIPNPNRNDKQGEAADRRVEILFDR